MKKLIRWTLILIVVVLLSLFILPFFFKDEIVNAVKKEANKNLTAQLNFNDVTLNLFSNFPNLALNLKGITIINKSPFEGDTLLNVEELKASINIISLLKGDEIRINSISIKKPQLTLFKLEDGSENYNIFNYEIDTAEKSEEKPLNIKLKELIIENAKFAYLDQTTNNLVAVNNYNQVLLSEFNDSINIHNVKSSADEFTVSMNGIKYLNKLNYRFNLKYSENIIEQQFDLMENEFNINNLILKFNGNIKLAENGTLLNIGFETARSNFNDILSLIPSFYKRNIKNLESSGKIEINGNINGLLSDSSTPSFNVSLKVEDGNVRDKEINVELNNVNITLNITNPNGEFDNTILDINKFNFLLGNKQFLGTLQIKKPESGPIIDSKIKGEIDLNELNNLLAFESVKKIEGNISADLQAKGDLSKISQNKFENFYANGKMIMNNFLLKSYLFDDEIKVSSADFNFEPNKLVITNLDSRIGESDLKANGELFNIFDYYFNKAALKGKIYTNSKYFNINQFIEAENGTSTNVDSLTFSAPTIPSNVNLLLDSKFAELIYDNLNINNVVGQVLIAEGKIILKDAKMNLLEGSLLVNGSYERKTEVENPNINFDLNINNFNISETYSKFLSVRKFVPIAKNIQGNFDSKIKLNTELNSNLEPIWDSFYSSGNLFVSSAEIRNYKPFTTLGNILNIEELSNPKIQKLNPSYKIENGRFIISPIEFNIKNYNITFSGSNGIDESIDYNFKIKIPSSALKNNANKTISNLLKKDLQLISSDHILVNAIVKGSINSPQISTNASETAGAIVKEMVEEVKKEIVEKVESTVDSLKIKAEEKLKEELAKKEEELKKKEEELKKKLEEEAKKKLQNLFKKKG